MLVSTIAQLIKILFSLSMPISNCVSPDRFSMFSIKTIFIFSLHVHFYLLIYLTRTHTIVGKIRQTKCCINLFEVTSRNIHAFCPFYGITFYSIYNFYQIGDMISGGMCFLHFREIDYCQTFLKNSA